MWYGVTVNVCFVIGSGTPSSSHLSRVSLRLMSWPMGFNIYRNNILRSAMDSSCRHDRSFLSLLSSLVCRRKSNS